MRYRRAIDAYGICRDDEGRTLVVGAALPGGAVAHGEHPADAVVRVTAAQTGYSVEVVALRDVLTDIDGRTHRDQVVFAVRAVADPVGLSVGTTVRWLPSAELATTPLRSSVRAMLGLGPPDTHQHRPGVRVSRARSRVQRFAAYGFVTDPAGNVLLTLIADRYPGAGRWHLPGGGTDFGESPRAGLAREITEETGQQGVIGDLMNVSHRYQRDARGPEGRPIDWHGVRAVYRVTIDAPTSPRVVDHGGSTAEARWFTSAQAGELPLTEVAEEALAQYPGEIDRCLRPHPFRNPGIIDDN